MVSQIIAVIIFITMFACIISGKVERYIPALIGAAAMIIVVFGICMRSTSAIWDTLNLRCFTTSEFWYAPGISESASSGINWSTILFFFGMMVLVEGMGKVGFFRWLCLWLAKAVRYRIVPIFITFMVLSAVLSMFIDSITVVLFLTAITIELSGLLKFNPVYMILPEIFCANLGGAATMSGDPPNIIIGTSLGLTFMDFLTNTGIIILIALIAMIIYFYLCFAKKLKEGSHMADSSAMPDPSSAISNRLGFLISTMIFLMVVFLLVTHAQTGITVASIGIIAAVLTLVTSVDVKGGLLRGIDWKTIYFFVGLFVVVGGLEQTHILDLLADIISRASGGHVMVMVCVILWFSALASAIIDNIPFAATMVPVIKALAITQGIPVETLAWTLALGTDIGGNATPIGASANVVGTSIASRNGHHITWGQYCRYALPATVLCLVICTVMLYILHVR